ncbi:MAG: cation:proton antiporter [Phycisphaerae bacterium]|jgi:multicomponent Na+:H+ antiporter subunit C
MLVLMAVVAGGLYAAGLYMMLARSIVRLIFGLVILGHAANLTIFTSARLVRGRPPLVPEGAAAPAPGYADPLPQALILTAIVIGFGLLAFTSVLVKRSYEVVGTDDSDQMTATES